MHSDSGRSRFSRLLQDADACGLTGPFLLIAQTNILTLRFATGADHEIFPVSLQ
jgi:hypothetical protein